MDDVRSGISSAVVPLALASAGLFALALVIGNRAWVLRRLGIWAVLAGLSWVVIPPIVVWLARRWAPGADAVAAVALDEAISGLFAVAVTLVVGGVMALVVSFAVRPAAESERAPAASHRDRSRAPQPSSVPAAVPAAATTTMPAAATPMPRTRATPPTAEVPVVGAAPAVAATAAPAPAQEPESDEDGDALWDYYSSRPTPR